MSGETGKENAVNRYVDMWALINLHPTDIDLLQRLKSADDRQFGSNMDVCGTVSEQDPKTLAWEKSHLVGIRSDIWNPDAQELQQTLNSLHKDRREQLRRGRQKSGQLNAKQKDHLRPTACRRSVDGPGDHRPRTPSPGDEDVQDDGRADPVELDNRRNHHPGSNDSIGSRRAVLTLAVMLPGYDYLVMVQAQTTAPSASRRSSRFVFSMKIEIDCGMSASNASGSPSGRTS